MSEPAWRPTPAAGPAGARRPRNKDFSRRERHPGRSDDFTRPINRRVDRTTHHPDEEDE
jgi:hypothetical protein